MRTRSARLEQGTSGDQPFDNGAPVRTSRESKPDIPNEIIAKWQRVVDLMAEIVGVPAGLIMKIDPPQIEVFIASSTKGNPYEKGERADLNTGLYCETVMSQRSRLLVPDALKDSDWDHNPDVKLGMISYLGFPLSWPDKDTFGTICVLDAKENRYSQAYAELIAQFQELIDTDLNLLCQRHELEEEITTRKQAEDELVAANKELEAFSYSVSHDLRTPLRSIDGFSQILLDDYADKLDEQGKGHLQRVRSAAQRMGQLIDDILSLSRIMRSEMERVPVDLSALAETIAEELKEGQPERKVEFIITNNLTANGDPRLLQVMLENLLGNAWKFTKKHPRARIEFGVKQDDDKPVFFVHDDGAGFDMTSVEKIFGPFQRLHDTSEYEGTGIGLTTVQRIVDRHGGQIWAEGEVEKGATFYFKLD